MNQVETINKKKKRKGFTLIELIIVLAVMAIIAAIAIPNFAAVRDNSKNKADVQSAETIKRTVLMLVSDGTLPAGAKTYTANFDATSKKITSVTNDTTDKKIEEALKDVKAPQGKAFTIVDGKPNHAADDAIKFVISVDDKGSVEVITAK